MKRINHKKIITTGAALLVALSMTLTTGCGSLAVLAGLGAAGYSITQEMIDEASENAESSSSGTSSDGSASQAHTTQETASSDDDSSSDNAAGNTSDGTYDNISIADGKYSYVSVDTDQMRDDIAALQDLASSDDSDEIIRLYDELYDDFLQLNENASIVYIIYAENPADEEISSLQHDLDNEYTELADLFLIALKEVSGGNCADAFEAHVGEDVFEGYSSYEAMTDREKELSEQETDLVDQYYTAVEENEENGGSEEDLYNTVGPIYVELVQVRTEIANINGYDSYADYADAEIYARDYSADDIQNFCDSVKKLSSRFYELTYSSSALYAPYYIPDYMSESEILSALGTYGSKISPIVSEAYEQLSENHLYSLGDDDARMNASFTDTLSKSGVPFIFSYLSDNLTDFESLSHEFGHFCAYTLNTNPNIFMYAYGDLDLAEIHSNGLQALYTYFYDDIYGSYSSIMETYCVMDLLSNITTGCLFDEFQRTVYNNPDMTLDEINQLYTDLCAEYGDTYSADSYWWVQVSHNFASPMYYFSYAASGFASLQIWLYTESSFDTAVDLWTQIVEIGSYEDGYTAVLDKVGISDFTNQVSVITLLDKALSYCESSSFRLSY